jgi:hypothetical protein
LQVYIILIYNCYQKVIKTNYTRFQNYATKDENARVDMSVLCHQSVTKFKLWVLPFLVDVYALYALYKQAYNDFQDILVRIIAKLSKSSKIDLIWYHHTIFIFTIHNFPIIHMQLHSQYALYICSSMETCMHLTNI